MNKFKGENMFNLLEELKKHTPFDENEEQSKNTVIIIMEFFGRPQPRNRPKQEARKPRKRQPDARRFATAQYII